MPEWAGNDAPDAIDLLASAGLELMDWQCVMLASFMGVAQNGRWAASICGSEVPRQQGKTRVIQGRMAAEMLFYGGSCIYTAQVQKTSTETFEEMAQLFDSPALRKYLVRGGIRTALGREEIRLKSGARAKFLARTRNGGNGQHGSLLVFDEAQYLEPEPQGSFTPAISACRTKRGAQTIYNGNAPEDGDYGLVFERIREGALAGRTKHTAWLEWGCSGGQPDITDRELWERVNPSWGVLLHPETIEGELESMEPAQFAHQRLGWFRERKAVESTLIPQEMWDAAEVDDAPESHDALTLGIKFTADGRLTSVSSCELLRDGTAHVEFIREEPAHIGIGWIIDMVRKNAKELHGIAIDGRAGADTLAMELSNVMNPRAIKVARTSDAINADSMLLDALRDERLTHIADDLLRKSALEATRRPIGRSGGFGFGGADSQRLDSCALALWSARTTKYDPRRRGRIG